jgi:hypothetical protein
MRNLKFSPIIFFIAFAMIFFQFGQQPSKVAAATAGSIIYRYDSLGRLAQAAYPVNSAAFAYDNVGNRSAFSQN